MVITNYIVYWLCNSTLNNIFFTQKWLLYKKKPNCIERNTQLVLIERKRKILLKKISERLKTQTRSRVKPNSSNTKFQNNNKAGRRRKRKLKLIPKSVLLNSNTYSKIVSSRFRNKKFLGYWRSAYHRKFSTKSNLPRVMRRRYKVYIKGSKESKNLLVGLRPSPTITHIYTVNSDLDHEHSESTSFKTNLPLLTRSVGGYVQQGTLFSYETYSNSWPLVGTIRSKTKFDFRSPKEWKLTQERLASSLRPKRKSKRFSRSGVAKTHIKLRLPHRVRRPRYFSSFKLRWVSSTKRLKHTQILSTHRKLPKTTIYGVKKRARYRPTNHTKKSITSRNPKAAKIMKKRRWANPFLRKIYRFRKRRKGKWYLKTNKHFGSARGKKRRLRTLRTWSYWPFKKHRLTKTKLRTKYLLLKTAHKDIVSIKLYYLLSIFKRTSSLRKARRVWKKPKYLKKRPLKYSKLILENPASGLTTLPLVNRLARYSRPSRRRSSRSRKSRKLLGLPERKGKLLTSRLYFLNSSQIKTKTTHRTFAKHKKERIRRWKKKRKLQSHARTILGSILTRVVFRRKKLPKTKSSSLRLYWSKLNRSLKFRTTTNLFSRNNYLQKLNSQKKLPTVNACNTSTYWRTNNLIKVRIMSKTNSLDFASTTDFVELPRLSSLVHLYFRRNTLPVIKLTKSAIRPKRFHMFSLGGSSLFVTYSYYMSKSFRKSYLYRIRKKSFSFVVSNEFEKFLYRRRRTFLSVRSLATLCGTRFKPLSRNALLNLSRRSSDTDTWQSFSNYLLWATPTDYSYYVSGKRPHYSPQFKSNSLSYYKRSQPKSHRKVVDFSIPRFNFRRGYQKLWRKYRSDLAEHLSLHYDYQKQITRYVTRLSIATPHNIHFKKDLTLVNVMVVSHFAPDLSTATVIVSRRLVSLNNKPVYNLNIILQPEDLLTLNISNWYYTFHKWLVNWAILKNKRLRRLIYYKGRAYKYKLSKHKKHKSYYIPKWVKCFVYDGMDVKPYLEVDFFTLSLVVLYDPSRYIFTRPLTLDDRRHNIYRLYNWKYIT